MNKNFKFKSETLKEFSKEFYIIPKGITGTIAPIKTIEEFNFLCSELDIFADGLNWGMLESGRIIYSKPKKFNEEEVIKIKAENGSQRAKAKKYNVSVGTINKIMNDKY